MRPQHRAWQHPGGVRLSRRAVGKAHPTALASLSTGGAASPPPTVEAQHARSASPESLPAPLSVRLTIHGREHTILVESRSDVLDALRETLALKALKKG
jgi:xanthine dehydrogenase YagT iron-sulfur-binding subunit